MLLHLKNVIFTVVVPGSVAIYIPLLIARSQSPISGTSQAIALAFLLLCSSLYVWCVCDFATFGRGTPLPVDAPKKLVVRGLYKYTRNPMYIGVLIIILGWNVLYQTLFLGLYAILVGACLHLFIVLYEEPRLEREFGEQYELIAAMLTAAPELPIRSPSISERLSSRANGINWI